MPLSEHIEPLPLRGAGLGQVLVGHLDRHLQVLLGEDVTLDPVDDELLDLLLMSV